MFNIPLLALMDFRKVRKLESNFRSGIAISVLRKKYSDNVKGDDITAFTSASHYSRERLIYCVIYLDIIFQLTMSNGNVVEQLSKVEP